MQPHVISNTQPEVQQAIGDSHTAHLQEAVIAQPVRKAFSPEERAGFYMGEDRLTLKPPSKGSWCKR
jgi:hypothetical protein